MRPLTKLYIALYLNHGRGGYLGLFRNIFKPPLKVDGHTAASARLDYHVQGKAITCIPRCILELVLAVATGSINCLVIFILI
jgi:hypothetical protein